MCTDQVPFRAASATLTRRKRRKLFSNKVGRNLRTRRHFRRFGIRIGAIDQSPTRLPEDVDVSDVTQPVSQFVRPSLINRSLVNREKIVSRWTFFGFGALTLICRWHRHRFSRGGLDIGDRRRKVEIVGGGRMFAFE
jgi:hypothetical protein